MQLLIMDSLNEIFEEILHSEQDFSAKIAELRNGQLIINSKSYSQRFTMLVMKLTVNSSEFTDQPGRESPP